MTSSAQRPRKRGYRHPPSVRGLRPESEMKRAREVAIKLAKELGTPYDGLSCAVAASKSNYGPDRWLIDTGSAFDLVGQHVVPD